MTQQGNDMVVVGGGIAGMVAAVRAAQAGLKVLVLEKGDDEHYLCNSRYTAGLFHVCSRAVTLPPDELDAIIAKATAGMARADVRRAIADHCFEVIRWLQEEGVRFVRAGAHEARQWGLAPVNLPQAGLNWQGRAGDVMLGKLEASLVAKGGAVLRGARAKSLRMEGGRCTGLVAQVKGQERVFDAQAVVIADGGFQANPDLLRRFVTATPPALMQRCAPSGTGDGLRMCEEVGASIVESGAFYGHLMGQDAMANPKLWPYPWFDEIAVVAAVVGPDGKRFADEGLGGTWVANRIAQLADPLSAVLVFGESIWQQQGRAAVVPPNELFEKHGGTLLRADSVAALAQQAGLPAQALQQSIDAHNAFAGGTALPADAVARTTAKHQPAAITGPFYAVKLVAGVTYTMGGIAIDGASRVLNREGQPMAGLLAAGATTGGLEGGGAAGYVGGLVKSSVTGFCAAGTVIETCGVNA